MFVDNNWYGQRSTLAEYCNLHLGFNMVSIEGLRKIIARIADENNLAL